MIAKLLIKKDAKDFNLSMFSVEEQRSIAGEIFKIYLRQGKPEDAIRLLEFVNPMEHSAVMKEIADKAMNMADYQRAALIYEKIGDKLMAEYIRGNFLKAK